MIQKTLIASAISLFLLAGCSDSNTPGNATDGSGDSSGSADSGSTDEGNSNGGETNPDLQNANRILQQLENSEAFYAALREGLIQQNMADMGLGVDGNGDDGTAVISAEQTPATDTGAGTDAALPESPVDSAEADSSPSESAGVVGTADVTGTNVQEVGVDEQDRMKSDGKYLYVLQNQYGDQYPVDTVVEEVPVAVEPDQQDPGEQNTDFVIELLPVTPSNDTAVPEPDQTTPGGPDPQNRVNIRILALNNDAPDAVPLRDLQLDLGGGFADGMYLFKNNEQRNLIVTSTSFNDYLYAWDNPYAFNNASSLILKLDVTDPQQANLGQSVKIDGQIISSRRIGDKLFVASRYYPALPEIDPYSMSPEEYQAAIEAVDLTQVLPQITGTDGSVTDLVNPGECFVAAKGDNSDYYYTPDIVSLSVIDLTTLKLADSECFLGSSEALYATPNSVYLATTRWGHSDFLIDEPRPEDPDVQFTDPRIDTDIHQFAINGAELSYSGSGVVSGHLGWNPTRMPFRMSEKDGYLRVATFSDMQNESVSPILLSILNVQGDGALAKVSELPNANNPEHIGKPGEQLYASRFIGDRAYLVTFRQTDPLYVVDLADPSAPKLAGELEIDGYSDYLQPIGENHLLGIGRDAVPGPVEWGEGALVQGVKLSLFDIADANNPTEVQSVVVGERGTEAAALYNHRAITIQAATDSHPARVALWFPWNFSGLHGFDINVGSGAGIEARGAMIVNSASNPQPSFDYYGGDDRSVIVGDSVYYVRSSDVYAATWSDLGNFVGPR